MDKIKITGGVPLEGTISIGGAKNAALPLMAASLLTKESLTLSNIPHLADISTMANLLVHMGVELNLDGSNSDDGHIGRVITLSAENMTETTAPYDMVRKMRASVVVLGPLVARFGRAKVSLPGGCAIGTRPIDLHLAALKALGAEIILEDGYVEAVAKQGLKGGEYTFPLVSVGATENAVMAATLADGETVLKNCAREPEVSDLCECLIKMGADINGVGTDTLTIRGVSELKGTQHRVIADRIETGTYAIAAMITGGELTIKDGNPDIMHSTFEVLQKMGAHIEVNDDVMTVKAGKAIQSMQLETQPYPGLATDMQAQLMALLSLGNGESTISETIFENRFMHVAELTRMGAKIDVHDHTAMIHGIEAFHGAEVMATDLRASVSLVLAGLAAHGETIINRVYHLDRGYEFVEDKLAMCGANILRVKG